MKKHYSFFYMHNDACARVCHASTRHDTCMLVLVACGVEHTRGYEREVAELQTQVHAVVSAELVLTVSC